MFGDSNLTLISEFLMWVKTHRCLVPIKDPKCVNVSSPSTYTSR